MAAPFLKVSFRVFMFACFFDILEVYLGDLGGTVLFIGSTSAAVGWSDGGVSCAAGEMAHFGTYIS